MLLVAEKSRPLAIPINISDAKDRKIRPPTMTLGGDHLVRTPNPSVGSPAQCVERISIGPITQFFAGIRIWVVVGLCHVSIKLSLIGQQRRLDRINIARDFRPFGPILHGNKVGDGHSGPDEQHRSHRTTQNDVRYMTIGVFRGSTSSLTDPYSADASPEDSSPADSSPASQPIPNNNPNTNGPMCLMCCTVSRPSTVHNHSAKPVRVHPSTWGTSMSTGKQTHWNHSWRGSRSGRSRRWRVVLAAIRR